ncbi:MAG TPA: DUF1800 domain-containing protein [Alphaproteobacteria bacterium]|nr:DUF1800 domain-containing protein [Alphaproteobacteria bacterium]
MRISKALRSLVLVSAAFLLASPAYSQTQQLTDEQILHVINRVSFGPTPGQIEQVRQMGLHEYLEQQLRPGNMQVSQDLINRLSQLEMANASMQQLAQHFADAEEDKKGMSQDEKKELRKSENVVVEQAAEAKILRAAGSPAQLQEVMTDFWFNHFNVFAEKGPVKLMVSAYERDAIRPYALGKFRDLLMATAHHPAMLVYLDNWENTDPSSNLAKGKKLGINENYAREIMELHTLGVNGGYTQQDVTNLAHILTGWGLGEGKGIEPKTTFYFEPRRHDYANVTLLNYTVRGGGTEEITGVLDMLAKNPATAHHIAFELAQYFVADDPPKALVDKMTASYVASDGDITSVLRTLFNSQEFYDPQYAQKKFKPPFRYVVSTLRAAGVLPPGDTKLLQAAMNQMGEPLYRCVTPNGYSNTNDQWLNSDALLKRVDYSKKFVGFLQSNPLPNIESAMGTTLSANTFKTIQAAPPKMQPVLALSAPEFVYY